MRSPLPLLPLLLLATTLSHPQKSEELQSPASFATDRCFSKGGLGIVNPNLYIAVKTDSNQLFYGSGGRAPNNWNGKPASQSEIVVFYDSRVWIPPNLPNHFDLSKAVVISFEQSRIRFFDFQSMSGCYYRRFKD